MSDGQVDSGGPLRLGGSCGSPRRRAVGLRFRYAVLRADRVSGRAAGLHTQWVGRAGRNVKRIASGSPDVDVAPQRSARKDG